MALPTSDDWSAWQPSGAAGWLIAFSGGLDSTVLLHLAARAGLPLRAIHVHHGLSDDADAWVAHCQVECGRLGIPLMVAHVAPDVRSGGVQAGARAARYSAMDKALATDEVLATAHHADDQAETVLLRLLRGTGVDGLSGIPRSTRFGGGWLVRPLLDARRDEIEAFARSEGLRWVEDPANAGERYQRSRLRSRTIPALTRETPNLVDSLSRLAAAAADERDLRAWLMDAQLERATGDGHDGLSVDILKTLPGFVQQGLLRHWIRKGGQRPPGRRRLIAGLDALLGAGVDRHPVIEWPEGRVARHDGWLYRLPAVLPDRPQQTRLGPDSRQADGAFPWRDAGSIVASPADGTPGVSREILQQPLWIRPAAPGERVRLSGRPSRLLREYFREAGVPPWWRDRWPVIINAAGETIAVPGIGVTQAGLAPPSEPRLRLDWRPAGRVDGPDWHWPGSPPPLPNA